MKNIIKNLFNTTATKEVLEQHTIVFDTTTETGKRDYHMISQMIDGIIDYDKIGWHHSQVIWDEEKITYVFECTEKEYETIHGIITMMRQVEQIRLRAEWK